MGPEHKPGLFPSEYTIPASKGDKFGLLVVEDCRSGIYIDQDRGMSEQFVDGRVVARSLVEDYVISQPGQDQNAGPGLFWVEGVAGDEKIKTDFSPQLTQAQGLQREWWKRLIRLADDTWQVDHKLAQIGDIDRMACRQLGLKRDWLDDSPDTIQKCPVCTTLISVSAIVCFACHVILKAEEYKKFQFAGAPVQPLNASPSVKV